MPIDKIVLQEDNVNLFTQAPEGTLSLCAAGGAEVFTILPSGEYSVEGTAVGYSPPLYAAFKELMHRLIVEGTP